MSDFDKYVAEWVTRAGGDVPKEAREQLLHNITDSLGDYEQLRDPAAAKARKEAAEKAKQRAEDRKSRENALEMQEESDRKRQERQANLPPLPPGMRKSESTAGTPAHDSDKPKKKVTKKKSSSGDGVGGRRKTGEFHEGSPNASSQHHSRRTSGSVQLKDIDFEFGTQVNEQLRRIEGEKPRSSTKKKPAPPPVEEQAEAPPPAAAAAAAEEKEGVATDSASTSVATTGGQKRHSPPPLSQVAAESADAAEPSRDDDSVPSLEQTGNFQKQLGEFRFASANNDGEDTEEEQGDVDGPPRSSAVDEEAEKDEAPEEDEFIDDREDARRRTMQMQRSSRPAISDSTLDIDEARIANFPTTPKSQNKVKTISRVLVRHFLFSTLDDGDIAKFASIMDLENFEAGEELLRKGEPNDTFYIILDGEAEVQVTDESGEPAVEALVRGSTCGDIALMYEVRNEATVVVRTAVQCATLERRTYKMITSRAMEEKRRKYIAFLSATPLFGSLSSAELERLAETLKEDIYGEGQKIIAYGVPNHWLHILMEGTLRVMAPEAEGEGETELAVVEPGHTVGEIEFIFHHLPVASVYAASPVVKTAKLSRRSFEQVPAPVREHLIRLVEEDASYAPYHARMHSSSPPAVDMTPPFDAPSVSLQKSMQQYESEYSEGTSTANHVPTPPPSNSDREL